ncbi:MAG: hypothetical protein MSG78_05270 [Clostridiales bacterium]|nr:hypothetical protein [Clostridiales bacterium]
MSGNFIKRFIIGSCFGIFLIGGPVRASEEAVSMIQTQQEITPTEEIIDDISVLQADTNVSVPEEPQKTIEQILDLDQSRIASTGVNCKAPVYMTLQLRDEYMNWNITVLVYESVSQPSQKIFIEPNMKQRGNYEAEYITTDAMVSGQWKLMEVWVMSPTRVVQCIGREESQFPKFDFVLVKPVIVEEGTEQGSLVEKTLAAQETEAMSMSTQAASQTITVYEQSSIAADQVGSDGMARSNELAVESDHSIYNSNSSKSISKGQNPSESQPMHNEAALTDVEFQTNTTIETDQAEQEEMIKKEMEITHNSVIPSHLFIMVLAIIAIAGILILLIKFFYFRLKK